MRDEYFLSLLSSKPNLSVPWYLMAAYAYYEKDDPILLDITFDWLAKFMLKNWDTIEHRHKHLITVDDLVAGTLMTRDFPDIIKDTANKLRKEKK